MHTIFVLEKNLPMRSVLISIDSVLFAFQQFSISRDFQIQSDLDIHKLLVLSELISHLCLKFFKLILQVLDLILIIINFSTVSIFHFIHGMSQSIVGTSQSFDFDLQSLLSLSIFVDLFSGISQRSLISSSL